MRYFSIVFLLIAAGALIGRPPAVRAQAPSVSEQYLFAAANAERAQRSLPLLHWDRALNQSAYVHAQAMAARQSISHQYPGEPELALRGKAAGAKFSIIAENVAEASTAVIIHDAWMNSPGHRANLLDPQVDAIGISVVRRNGQLYAVQDFERSVVALSYDQQENAVERLVAASAALRVERSDDARRTCEMETGWAGARQPWFVMRFTAGELTRLPETLVQKMATGKYHEAAVGACRPATDQPFSSYSIAVMLYP